MNSRDEVGRFVADREVLMSGDGSLRVVAFTHHDGVLFVATVGIS
uniref:Uncharacterized protein n=1 Tax=Streptomyces sp. NBC_01393 TaxID=2903851 RepID=A0AAU3HST3_9ACTN